MRRFPILRSLFMLGLVAPLLAAAPAHAAHFSVVASSNLFTPSELHVQVGDTVTWSNLQGSHSVEADDGSFASGPASDAGWTYSFTFETPGSFPYFSLGHGAPGGTGMGGVVYV